MYLFFITRQGTVKRTSVNEFGNIRKNGLKAITLRDGDELINVLATDDSKNIIIGTHQGYAVSFDEKISDQWVVLLLVLEVSVFVITTM